MRLSEQNQLAVLHGLPPMTKKKVKKLCRDCEQQGDGIKDILAKVGAFLSPLVKEVGPTVLKEFIIPFLIKKGKEKYGLGLGLAGRGHGSGLKIAGQGKKKAAHLVKGSAEAKAHMAKLRAMRKK